MFLLKRAFSNRRAKNDYRKPKRMTHKSLEALKKRSKLSKKLYANPSMINKEQLNRYLKCSCEIVIDAKDNSHNETIIT